MGCSFYIELLTKFKFALQHYEDSQRWISFFVNNLIFLVFLLLQKVSHFLKLLNIHTFENSHM